MVVILVVLTIVALVILDSFARHRVARSLVVPVNTPNDLIQMPNGIFVAPGHTWLQLDSAGSVSLGAGRLPLVVLGGADRIEVPAEGTVVQRGDPLARIRRGWREVQLRSPVDGIVTRINETALSDPHRLITDPFGESWLCRVQPRNLGQTLRGMFVAEEAVQWMSRELRRLREFLSGRASAAVGPVATLPDGGLPVAGVAERLDSDDWDALLKRFFETEWGESRHV